MHRSEPQDSIDRFTLELFRTGVCLTDLVEDLTDAAEPGAFPDEDPCEAIIEMVEGSIRTYLQAEDSAEVQRATALIAGASDRVVEHLQLALELRRRMDAGVRGGDGCSLEGGDPAAAEHLRKDLLLGDPSDEDLLGDDEVQALVDAVNVDRELDELDRLVIELLDCGAYLSQIVISMARHDRAAADDGDGVVSIPDGARNLLRAVLDEISHTFSDADITVARNIVEAVNDTFGEDVFILNPDVQ